MNYPRITVIMPSYNQGAYLEPTILSILNQGYPNLEYIIIDGKSTDNTLEIVAKYEDKITHFVTQKNNGLNDAINKGLSMATGEIISILNAGNYYEPYALFKVATTFTSERINVVCGRGRIFKDNQKDQQANQETIKITEGVDVFAYNLAKTIGWANINQPEIFFRKIVIDKIGLLNINLDTFVATDWWIRYLFAFGVENIIKTMDLLVNVRENISENSTQMSSRDTINRDTFYYLLASCLRLYDYSYVIKNNSILKPDFNIQNTYSYQNESDELLSLKSLNYFALLRANEAFAEKNIPKTKDFLKQIQKKLLDNEDKKSFSNLSFKCKLPSWLRKIL